MEPHVLDKIRSINREFYQTFAEPFAETRRRLQPGVQRLMPDLNRSQSLLDLGCGNGELAARLVEQEFDGRYLGLDVSEPMLAIASNALADRDHYAFVHAEIGATDLESVIQSSVQKAFHPPYDHQIAFATLHHIPGHSVREALVRTLHKLAKQDGYLFLSVWNFLESERLRERILPWETIGLSESQVEPGDFLIDWRRDGTGIRYVHHFSEIELSDLAEQGGFQVRETFYSDGETGTLGLYQIWECQ